MRECPVQLLIEPIFYLCWRNLRSVAEYSDIPPHHVIPSGVEEPALGRSREAGFSTAQNCPRADNLAALEMTEEVFVSLYCAIFSKVEAEAAVEALALRVIADRIETEKVGQ